MELVVGRIGRPHGLRGEVTVEVRTDSPAERFVPGHSIATDPPRSAPLCIDSVRWNSGRLLLGFADVGDRAAAESLRGLLLLVEVPAQERPADAEEFYDHQLVGLAVHTVAGAVVGAIAEVLHLPSQDLLAVRTTAGREVLVPFVAQLVPEVDLTAGLVRIDPPTGLLDGFDPPDDLP